MSKSGLLILAGRAHDPGTRRLKPGLSQGLDEAVTLMFTLPSHALPSLASPPPCRAKPSLAMLLYLYTEKVTSRLTYLLITDADADACGCHLASFGWLPGVKSVWGLAACQSPG